MRKLVLTLNIVTACLLGTFFGAFLSLYILVYFFNDTLPIISIDSISANIFIAVIFIPPIMSGLLLVFLEIKKSGITIIRYFQGSVLKKLSLGLLVIAVTFTGLAVKIKTVTKYQKYGKEIINKIEMCVAEGERIIVLDNQFGLDYVLVTEAYSLTENALLKTGKIDRRTAKSMARRNADSEGIYMHLAKHNKVLAVASFPGHFSVENKFQIAKVKDKITFHIRRQTQTKNEASKEGYEKNIITGIE